MSTRVNDESPLPEGRWTKGASIDQRAKFDVIEHMEPVGAVPALGPARPDSGAQKEQM